MTQDETLATLGDECSRALSLIRRMAERFDGASNGKCTVCGARRGTSGWGDVARAMGLADAPYPCSNENCKSLRMRAEEEANG